MINKNNIKHMLILAFSFFSCSYVYLVQSMMLRQYSNVKFANMVSVLYGSFAMALGIFLFGILYKRTKRIKQYFILFMLFYMISIITFFATTNPVIMSVCLCLSCLFGTAGFGAGYSYSLIATNVEKEYQGRVYSIGYAIGSILTQIITLFSSYVYKPVFCLIVNLILIFITICLVYKVKELQEYRHEKQTNSIKKYIIALVVIIISMEVISSISQVIIGFKTFNTDNWFANTRIYYSLGLILAGILYDKKKDIFEVLLLISFIYSLVSIVLLNQNISAIIVSALSYFFLGFLSLFRAFIFINLVRKKKNLLYIAAYGLMLERVVEGVVAAVQNQLMDHYLLSLILEALFLSIVLWLYLFFYLKDNRSSENEKVKELSLKSGLSIQEEKVLNLMIKDLSNQEMADNLYLSVNTIRNHVASIYKKTGMNKKELREKCCFRTN